MEANDLLFNARAYALEQAVKLHASDGPPPISSVRNSEVIETARRFERYLSEQSADQQATTPPCISEKVDA